MNLDRFRPSRSLMLVLCGIAGFALSGCGGVLDATIGGTVTGLSGGTSLVLVDNGADPITVPGNGTFTFDQTVQAQNAYNVTVQTQPIGETCTVTNGTGTVTQNGGNVTDVTVTCNATTTDANYVYATVSGLASGQSVVLSDGTSTKTFGTSDEGAPVAFPTALSTGTAYTVTVATQPSGQTCTVTANGSGTISSSGSNSAATVVCQ
jgi:hypothetical protein